MKDIWEWIKHHVVGTSIILLVVIIFVVRQIVWNQKKPTKTELEQEIVYYLTEENPKDLLETLYGYLEDDPNSYSDEQKREFREYALFVYDWVEMLEKLGYDLGEKLPSQ